MVCNVNLGGVLAVTTGVGHLGWVMLSGAVALVAIIRVLRQPASTWKRRNWSKLLWVIAILYVALPIAGYPIPLGAIAAIWRTGRRRDSATCPTPLPLEEGSSDWPFPWDSK